MKSAELTVTTFDNDAIANPSMNRNHKVHLDLVQYPHKPNHVEAGLITTRITNHAMEISVENLAESICKGQTWTPAYFEGNRNNQNWVSQSIFTLDFDLGIPHANLLKRLKDQGLDCTFAYASFSSSPDFPKYRFVWQVDHLVTDTTEQNRIMYALKTILPEHDRKAVSLAQMFYGGTELIYENYNYWLDLPQLFIELSVCCVSSSKSGNVSRDLARLNKKLGNSVGMKNGNVYNNNYKQDQISSNPYNAQQLLKVDWGALTKEIRVLNDLLAGKWLDYPTYFGLASNLVYLNGGVTRYKESLDKMVELNRENPEFLKSLQEKPEFLNKLYKLPSVIKWYKDYHDYHPERLENFSPYKEDWIYSNLLHAVRKSEMVRVKPYTTISLAEAEQKFNDTFDAAIESQDTNVHVFKVATGLGKTRRLENLQGVLIALPNHDLKAEVAGRMKVPVMVTPNLPNDLSPVVQETIDYYFSIGAIEEANRFIAQEAEINPDLADYLKQLKSAYASGETVLTSHPKALFIDFNNLDTIIFDEDPLPHLFSIGNISINDLFRLRGRLTDEVDKQLIDDYVELLMAAEKNCPLKSREIEPRSFEAIEGEVLGNSYKYQGNVLAFFKSDWYMLDPHDSCKIHFIKINALPVDRKVIILSATADEQIYRKLLGDRLKFYDLSNVEMMGVIEQDSTFSFSRSSLENEKHLVYAKKQVGNLPVLTFKTYKDKFDTPVKLMHYGKLSGFDDLAGKNIAVVGTPHKHTVFYVLYAVALGIEFSSQDVKMQVQSIERNGIRFSLNTYAHTGLKTIHLFFLESEQEQAIGRARPIRFPVRIKLFSSLPHPQACINEDEKELNQEKFD